METIRLSLGAQVAVGTFFIKSPVAKILGVLEAHHQKKGNFTFKLEWSFN